MKYEDFQEKFHDLHTECNYQISREEDILERYVAHQKKELRKRINDEYWNKIGDHFKKMNFDDKREFLKNYVRRDLLEQFLEPHELTAYRMIK